MALPTSRAGGAKGAVLPSRTTLTDLRSRPVTELPGVGVRIEAALGDLGIASLADMISHYPSRHEDLSNVKRISELRVGERATVFGSVVSTRPVGKPVRGRAPGFSAQLYDGTGYIPVTVWGRSWLLNQLLPEVRVVASGEVQSRYGIQIVARSIEVVDDPRGDEGPHAGRFVPVYPVNKGIQARKMRTLIHRALDAAGRILDPLPADVLVSHSLPNLHDAIHEVHFPTERARLKAAMRRLVFHELFLIQAGLAARKARIERTEIGVRHRGDGSLLNPFLKGLSFGLTGAQEQIAAGEAHVVVGTHALIQKRVDFDDLSLVVVDEQHRFGVGQRTVFREKGSTPDTLVMTATPIPRTLSLTLYGDLEVSVLDELPPGRKPVKTRLIELSERKEAYEAVRAELEAGRQAYVICPLVEESEALEDVRAAEELFDELAEEIFPEHRVGLFHGRMKAQDKREVMASFRSGDTDVLVATVVVEVGVDVPNASAIVIEGSERFGLSQLHQLRGRVCRGLHSPKCFLVGDPKTEDSLKRFEALAEHQDGFKLSEVDLAIRGEGTLFGSRQSGMPDLKVAKLLRDVGVLVEARREAFALVAGDPTLQRPDHRPLRREIRELLGADVEWLFRE